MSKSAAFPHDIMFDTCVIRGSKDENGRFMPIMAVLDLDLNKENLEMIESTVTSTLLKYDDRYNNYFWNTSGSYFLGDSLL